MCSNPNCNGCNKCQNSILNNQSSIIPSPLCAPTCLPVTGCEDTFPSNCVIYYGPNLSCTGILTNDNIAIALSKINSSICSIAPSGVNCNIYASCTDPCPSALVNKITSNTLSVTLNTNGITSCQTVDIEDNPWNFTNLSPRSGFTTPSSAGYSQVRFGVRTNYPTTNNLLEVRFHGQVQTTSFITIISNTSPSQPVLVFQLPSSAYYPTTNKYYSGITFSIIGSPVVIYYTIIIYTSGIVGIYCFSLYDGLIQAIIPFDGINYIKN